MACCSGNITKQLFLLTQPHNNLSSNIVTQHPFSKQHVSCCFLRLLHTNHMHYLWSFCLHFPCAVSAGAADIPPFDFSKFKDADAAAQEFVKYHEEQLRACGLTMGCRNGYTVHDLHKQKLYSLQIGQRRSTGGVDGGVLPYAVLQDQRQNCCGLDFYTSSPLKTRLPIG